MGTGTGAGAVCSLITLVEICFVLFYFLLVFFHFLLCLFSFCYIILHFVLYCCSSTV